MENFLKHLKPIKSTGKCLTLTKEEKDEAKRMKPYYTKRKILLAREYADCLEKSIRMKHKRYEELHGYLGITFG